MRLYRLRLLLPLLLAALACNTYNNLFTIPGPEDLATDDVSVPTRTPAAPPSASPSSKSTAAPTASIVPPATPSDLPYSLDQASDAQAALLPSFAADAAALPQASHYVIDVTISFDGSRAAAFTGREAIRYINREPA